MNSHLHMPYSPYGTPIEWQVSFHTQCLMLTWRYLFEFLLPHPQLNPRVAREYYDLLIKNGIVLQ